MMRAQQLLQHRFPDTRGFARRIAAIGMPLVLALIPMLAFVLAPAARASVTALANQPFITTVNVPGNVALTLSVEYPTATSIGNGIVNYSSSKHYYGIFDATRCYTYTTVTTKNGSTSGGSYFQPSTLANSDYSCTGAGTNNLWSGNFLNWAAMSTIDSFRWALTGGYRSIDTTSLTILEKSWMPPGQASYTESPVQTTSQTTYPNITPFTSWSSISTTNFQLGQYLCFTGTGTTGNGTLGSPAATYSNSTSNFSGSISNATEYNSASTQTASNVYCVEGRVQVCNASAPTGVESNCAAYPAGATSPTDYKPEGLIQHYSGQMRFAAFGYLLDSASNGNIGVRDGAVMRARMNFLGPTEPVPGSADITNPSPEWDASTGIFYANPDSTDQGNTVSACTTAGSSCTVPNSGVINYLNNFGEHARSLGNTAGYKGLDNVSELYYTVLRYYKELGNVPEYTALNSYNTDLAKSDCVKYGADQCVDGFPVITDWYPTDTNAPRGADYPIQYACQKNYIIGIGDDNTHQDENVPGTYSGGAYLSAGKSSSYEPPLESLVASDSTLNTAPYDTTNITNWIGTQEGKINGNTVSSSNPLGQTALTSFLSCCGGASYYIAGLAYDAHVRDLLPNAFPNADGTTPKKTIQTLSTYWVDVLEYGTFYNQNQYWMATKYGGFSVPTGYTEFTAPTSAGVAWSTALWATQGRTVYNGATAYTVPDNYYSGRDSGAMVSGLSTAFQQISADISATTTALSLSTPQVASSNNASYSVNYDARTWASELVASSLAYDANGNPTLTTVWDAQSTLDAQVKAGSAPTYGRNIATWSDSANSGAGGPVPFIASSLSTTEQSELTGTVNVSTTGTTTTYATADNVVSYLRGDRSNEGGSGSGYFRSRPLPGLLGDIVDSRAVTVGAPSAAIQTSHNAGYDTFQTTWATRPTVVYVGSNDGMLHAFDGSISGTDSLAGSELFAYVPGALYAGPTATPAVNGLVSRTYKTFSHYYMVNASPVIQDVDFKNAGGSFNSTSNDWHSLLVGGLGKGGMAFYALDVTNPAAMNSDANVVSKVLWEFNQTTINNYGGTTATIGYSFGPAVITKTVKYGWVVILTSGFDNSDGIGYFFFVNPKTGALLEPPLSVGAGSKTSPLGLTFASAYVPDYTDGTADALYAGDLYGNVWRVDLTTTTGNYSTPVKIAQVVDPVAGNAQPITTRPLIELSSSTGSRYVLFGTGKTLASTDLYSTQQNTIYSVFDGTGSAGGFLTSSTLPSGVTYPVKRSNLNAVTSANYLTGIGTSPTQPMGWYIDLAAASTGIPAEQMDVEPSADNGVAAFGVNLSNGSTCNPQGTGRILAVDVGNATSELRDSNNSPIASFNNGGSMLRVVDVTFVNVNGSAIRLTAGTDGTNAPLVNVSGVYSTNGKTTKLNWREVKGAN